MPIADSDSDSGSSLTENEEAKVTDKYITFRNHGQEKAIVAKVPIPRLIQLTHNQSHDLSALRNKLKMLYIDVLCRGYHPIKGFEAQARHVFKEVDETQTSQITFVCNNEALSTIWRCLSRQIGRPIKNYRMEEVQTQIHSKITQMKAVALRGKKESHSSHDGHRGKLHELQTLEDSIQKQLTKIAEKLKKDEERLEEGKMKVASVLSEQIISLEREIFLKTITGVKQWEENSEIVQVLLEQCYPSIKMSKAIAAKLLGEETLKHKSELYKSYQENYGLSAEGEMLSCHRCLGPLHSLQKLVGCDDKYASLDVSQTLLTNPYLYNRSVINENCVERTAVKKYIHPYLIYYGTSNDPQTAVCNRFFCNKCQPMEPSLQAEGHCNFCEGLCDCFRCQNMDLLTKMMAVFIDNRGNLQTLTSNFLMVFQSKLLKPRKKKKQKFRGEKEQQFSQYMQFFIKNKIFKKREYGERYEPIRYFSEKAIVQSLDKMPKNKMDKLHVGEERTNKQERKRKDRQAQEEFKRLNRIARGQGGRVNQRSQQVGNTKANMERPKSPEPKSPEAIDCYYEDSSS